MSLNNADFEYIRKLIRDRSAISLEAGKEYLVESRLNAVARKEKFDSLESLIAALRQNPYSDLVAKAVEAMTTNETTFFRDNHPFEALKRKVLPEIIGKRQAERRLNIWCAACSSGQEPYTIAMILLEHFPELKDWLVRIVASDLSNEMLARTRAGRYSQIEVNRGLPTPLLAKYFQAQGIEWQISNDLRRMVEPVQVNLSADWPALPPMDIIFIRNVLIYFDVEMKKTILSKARRLLRPDGYLFLGAAETTMNIDDNFDRIQFELSGCYKLRSGIAGSAASTAPVSTTR
jgi:chemotaxis protein methyltransferase CheR